MTYAPSGRTGIEEEDYYYYYDILPVRMCPILSLTFL
jgi:hypothetical protein